MNLPVHVVVWMLSLQYASSLRVLSEQRQKEPVDTLDEKLAGEEKKMLRRFLESLANTKTYLTGDAPLRREHGHSKHSDEDVDNTRQVVNGLAHKMAPHEMHEFLAKSVDSHNKKPLQKGETLHSKLVEEELSHALHKHSMVIQDDAHIENKGRNDFLVMDPGYHDNFVTVIPNSVYYGIEKKCANWLDDCSLQGIRARLLQRVKSPYK